MNESRSEAKTRLTEVNRLISEAKQQLISLQDEKQRLNQLLYAPSLPETMPPIPKEMPGFSQALMGAKVAPFQPLENPLPPIPTAEQVREANKRQVGFEINFGRWLARIGVLFALITVISFSAVFFSSVGPLAKVMVLAVVSGVMTWGGLELERRDSKVVIFARTLAGGGLACLYFTLYGAANLDSLRVIDSPFLGGALLLAWSGFVLYLGEKKKSELLSFFSIALAYFSSAINPADNFMLGADLLLAATSVALLIRNSWLSLSYFCLFATYIGLLSSIIQFDNSGLKSINVQFWPCVAYLMGAWVIHNVGLYSVTKTQAIVRRVPYLSLNNGGLVGMMILSAGMSHFGQYGTIFFILGCLFCAMSGVTGRVLPDCPTVAGWYLFQGLMLITAAIVEHFTGGSRAMLLTAEMVLMVGAGTYSGSFGLRALGYIVTLLALLFITVEIAAQPDSLGLLLSGFIATLVSGFIARRGKTEISAEAVIFVTSASLFLGIGAAVYGSQSPLLMERTEIALSVLAVVVTLFAWSSFYPELGLGGQILLSFSGCYLLGNGSTAVYAVTVEVLSLAFVSFLFMRREPAFSHPNLQPFVLTSVCFYGILAALVALVGIDANSNETIVIASAVLSVAFLVFGRVACPWPFALAGQILLANSVVVILAEGNGTWNLFAELLPIAAVLGTAWVFENWAKRDPNDFGQAGFAQALPTPLKKVILPITVAYRMFVVALFAKFLDPRLSHDQLVIALLTIGLVLVIAEEFIPFSAAALCAFTADAIACPIYLINGKDDGIPWHLVGLALLIAQVAILVKTKTPRRFGLMGINFVACICIVVYIVQWTQVNLSHFDKIPVFCLGAVLVTALGLWARLIQPVVAGQVLLVIGLQYFLIPNLTTGERTTELSPTEACLTIPAWLSVLAVGWMSKALSTPNWETEVRITSRAYRFVGILLLALWVGRSFPDWAVCAILMYIGTSISLVNLLLRNLFGARCGVALGAIGVIYYIACRIPNEGWVEVADGIGFACLILQSTVFRYLARDLVSSQERNAIVGFTCLSGWLFVGNAFPWPHYATMVWAIYAVGITATGFTFNERAQRVVGLGILFIAMIRVGLVDFWDFPGLLKVFTFFALTIGCLSLSYLYHRFGERMKEWL